MTTTFDYEKFLQASRFANALMHFGVVAFNKNIEHNSKYHLSEFADSVKALGFPVVTCGTILNKKGKVTITIRWNHGDERVVLYPNEAAAAMEWVNARYAEHYGIII